MSVGGSGSLDLFYLEMPRDVTFRDPLPARRGASARTLISLQIIVYLVYCVPISNMRDIVKWNEGRFWWMVDGRWCMLVGASEYR